MQGKPALSAPIARRLLGCFHEPEGLGAPVSPREQEVLSQLAKGLTIAEVAQALGCLAPQTAASDTKALHRKLEVTNRAEATIEATRCGLIKP